MKLKKLIIWSQSDYEHLDLYICIFLSTDHFLKEDFIRKHLSFFVFHTQPGVCRQDQSVFYSSEQTNLRQTSEKKINRAPSAEVTAWTCGAPLSVLFGSL